MFEAAQVLHVPPWEVAGFTYTNLAHMPVCWREWAWEFARVKATLQAEAQQRQAVAWM